MSVHRIFKVVSIDCDSFDVLHTAQVSHMSDEDKVRLGAQQAALLQLQVVWFSHVYCHIDWNEEGGCRFGFIRWKLGLNDCSSI